MTSNVTTIKLEEGQESVTQIQTYLETFNKKIEGGQGQQIGHVQLQQMEGLPDGEEDGTYFVDQSGQYYYQANNDETPMMAQVQIQKVEEAGVQNEEETLEEEEEFDEIGKLENVDGDEDGHVGSNGNNEVVINSSDAYQTVTVVPSDTNPSQVSYVLIVQQPNDEGKESRLVEQEGTEGEEGKGEQDPAVYDCEDNEDIEAVESGAEDDKTKIIKVVPKKSQTVTETHMCTYCNYTSPKRYLLSRHMITHSEERPHKCCVCDRGFKTLTALQNHVNTHTGTKPHRCKYCESAFTTSGELIRHVRYRHTHEKPHKCSQCDYASVELSKLQRHIRCHTGERPYRCPHCTYASPDTFKLKRHMRKHTGEKPYVCDFCQAKFSQPSSLKAHKYKHNVGAKPAFQCELCPIKCKRKTDLRIHVRKLHTSEKPVKCKHCEKSFPDRYCQKLHSKTHEGEKCYKCDLCPYASKSQRHLKSHMLVHTDQKSYQCDHCLQSFRQKHLLKRHCNTYHNSTYVPPPPQEKPHQYPECERSFRHKGNLIRHMAVHDPESSVQEKQQALRTGREKKIQIIDGQRVEVMTGDLATKFKDYEEEDADDVMAVEGSDGQRYVVLEVIHLAGNRGTDRQMAVVTNKDGDLMMQDPLNKESEIVTGRGEEGDEVEDDIEINEIKIELEECNKSLSRNMQSDSDLQKEMETCFGFDEEEEEEGEANGDINILQTIS